MLCYHVYLFVRVRNANGLGLLILLWCILDPSWGILVEIFVKSADLLVIVINVGLHFWLASGWSDSGRGSSAKSAEARFWRVANGSGILLRLWSDLGKRHYKGVLQKYAAPKAYCKSLARASVVGLGDSRERCCGRGDN